MSNRTFWILSAAWVIVALQAAIVIPQAGFDFHVFHTAAERFLRGEAIYRLEEVHPYKYAPGAVLLFAPFALLPFKMAFFVWNAIGGVLLAYALVSFGRGLPLKAHLVVSLIISVYAHYGFGLGQCDPIMLAAVALFWRYRDERPFVSGLAMSVAVALKLPFLAVAGLALVFGRFRQFAGVLVGLAVFVCAPTIAYGLDAFGQYATWQELLKVSTSPWLCFKDNQSAWTWFCQSGTDAAEPYMSKIMVTALLIGLAHALAVLLVWRKSRPLAEELALALALHITVCFSPLGWRANHVAMAAVAYLAWRHRAWWVIAPLVALLGLNYEVLLHNAKLLEQLLLLRVIGLFSLLSALLLSATLVRRTATSP